MLSACKHETFNVPIETIALPDDAPVRDIMLYNDTLFAASGTAIYHLSSVNSAVFEPVFKSRVDLYSLAFYDNEWFAGGDGVIMFRGRKLSAMKRHVWLEPDWVSDLSKHPIRAMVSDDKGLLAVAGGKLSFGVLYQSYDQGATWNPMEPENELRAAHLSDGLAWVAGNGILLKSEWGSGEWHRLPLENQFITGIAFKNRLEGWLLTQKGEILKTLDSGKSWDRVYKGKSDFMHHLLISGQFIIAVGNEGEVLVSMNNGNAWKRVKVETDSDLLDAVVWGEQCFAATSEGELISFSLDDLK